MRTHDRTGRREASEQQQQQQLRDHHLLPGKQADRLCAETTAFNLDILIHEI